MPFTLQDSIQTILNDPNVGKRLDAFFPLELLQFVPKDLWTHPLQEVGETVKMPWGMPFGAAAIVQAANGAEEIFTSPNVRFIPLWGEETEGYVPDYSANDKSSTSLLILNRETPEKPLPTVIICPGGAYVSLARENEGYTVAKRMEAAGWRAFVLNYRYSPNYWPEPAKDLVLAVKYVRANADRYGVDPDRLMVMGYSAGGHLCASYGAWYEEIETALMADLKQEVPALWEKYQGIPMRPDMICLSYALVSCMEDDACYGNLTGGDESLREKLSIERQVRPGYPKTFVWACEDDELVPVDNARWMDAALEKAGVPHLTKLYPTGGHGCGLGAGTSASGWSDEMLAFMA